MAHKQTPAAVYTARIPLAEGEADLVVTPAFLLNGDKVVKQILSGTVQMGAIIDEIRNLLIHHAGEEEGALIASALDGTSTDGLANFVNAWITTTSADSKYVEKHLVTDEDIAAEFFGLLQVADPDANAEAEADTGTSDDADEPIAADDIVGWRVDSEAGMLVAYDEDGNDGQRVAPEEFDLEAEAANLGLGEEETQALGSLLQGLIRARSLEQRMQDGDSVSSDEVPATLLAMSKAAAMYPTEAPLLPSENQVRQLTENGLLTESEAHTILLEILRRDRLPREDYPYPDHNSPEAAEAAQAWMRGREDLWEMISRAALSDLGMPDNLIDMVIESERPEKAPALEAETALCGYCFRQVEVRENGRMYPHDENPYGPGGVCQGSERKPKKPKGGLWFR